MFPEYKGRASENRSYSHRARSKEYSPSPLPVRIPSLFRIAQGFGKIRLWLCVPGFRTGLLLCIKRWLWRRLNRERGASSAMRKKKRARIKKSRMQKQRASCNTATGWLKKEFFSPYSFASPPYSGFAPLFFHIVAYLCIFCQYFQEKFAVYFGKKSATETAMSVFGKFFLQCRGFLCYTRPVNSKTGETRRRKAKGTTPIVNRKVSQLPQKESGSFFICENVRNYCNNWPDLLE